MSTATSPEFAPSFDQPIRRGRQFDSFHSITGFARFVQESDDHITWRVSAVALLIEPRIQTCIGYHATPQSYITDFGQTSDLYGTGQL